MASILVFVAATRNKGSNPATKDLLQGSHYKNDRLGYIFRPLFFKFNREQDKIFHSSNIQIFRAAGPMARRLTTTFHGFNLRTRYQEIAGSIPASLTLLFAFEFYLFLHFKIVEVVCVVVVAFLFLLVRREQHASE